MTLLFRAVVVVDKERGKQPKGRKQARASPPKRPASLTPTPLLLFPSSPLLAFFSMQKRARDPSFSETSSPKRAASEDPSDHDTPSSSSTHPSIIDPALLAGGSGLEIRSDSDTSPPPPSSGTPTEADSQILLYDEQLTLITSTSKQNPSSSPPPLLELTTPCSFLRFFLLFQTSKSNLSTLTMSGIS